ncbi:MAG: VC0807 family protein [Rhizomicrobium sp.]|jgi:intracellular septation protein A
MSNHPAAVAETEPRFHPVQLLPTLIFDVAMPIIVFDGLTHYGVSVLWAVVASGLSPALNNLRTWIRSRRLEPLGIIVVSLIAIGAAASFISGNVFFALIKDSFLTGTFGAICLVSLFAKRPLLFYVVRQFVAGDDAARIAWWNGLWDFPHFRRGMRLVTVVWGVVYIAEASARVVLALKLPPAEVISLSPIMGFGALVLLIMWTRRYMLAVRERAARGAGAAA